CPFSRAASALSFHHNRKIGPAQWARCRSALVVRMSAASLRPPLQGEGRRPEGAAGWGSLDRPKPRGERTPPGLAALAHPPPAGEGEDATASPAAPHRSTVAAPGSACAGR